MKIILWPEIEDTAWYCFAICDMDGKATGSIYRSEDYGFLLNHAEYFASRLGLKVEDKVAKTIQKQLV